MEITVRETIKKTILKHLKKKNGLILGQCLSAVGWVGGTIPELTEKEGVIELSMADVANGGIVVGAGLSNRRPIYVIRYQGFNWFNAPAAVLCTKALIGAEPSLLITTQSTPEAFALRRQAPKFLGS